MRARTELLIGGAGVLAGAALSAVDPSGQGALEVACAAVIGGALGLGRARPRAAWLIALAGIAALVAQGVVPYGLLPVVAAHAFCAGRWDTPWAGVVGTAALISAMLVGVALTGDAAVPVLIIPPAGWGAGRALRDRELVAAQLEERARELEAEREAHARLSVRYERARIASELHDIVAHAISVMVVQASAGQRLAARDPELAAESFQAIAGAARQAEEDMGLLVALLSDEQTVGPAPDLSVVEELVTRASGSGLDVTLRLEGEREGLPAEVVSAANHVVREGLTNSLRHAPGAAVDVRLRGTASELVVEVENAASPAEDPTLDGVGTGTGVTGLRERVDACSGVLDAGPTPPGGWMLAARLPRRVAVSPRSP